MAWRPRSGAARTLNGALGRRGCAFAHRYHSRELASPLEVKRALNYVIHNGRKHHLQAGQHVSRRESMPD